MKFLQRFSLMVLLAMMFTQISYSQPLKFKTNYRLNDRSLNPIKSEITIDNEILKINGVQKGLTGRLKPIAKHNSKNKIYTLERKDQSGPRGHDTIIKDTVEVNFDKKGRPVSMTYSYAMLSKTNQNEKDVYLTTEASDAYITNYLIGKKFYHRTQTCSELVGGGGYMSYSHTILEFRPQIVLISLWEDREPDYEKSEVQKPKQYIYHVQDTMIKVKGVFEPLNLAIELPYMLVHTFGSDIARRREWVYLKRVN